MVEKICVICGKEFASNRDWQLTCSRECSKNLNCLRQSEQSKSPHRRVSEAKIIKLKKAATEAAHKLRLQRQHEARVLGLSYAQYIAQNGIREI